MSSESYLGGVEAYKKWCNQEITLEELIEIDREKNESMNLTAKEKKCKEKYYESLVPVKEPKQNTPMEDAPDLVDKFFGEFVDEFLRCAEVIYKTLEAEDHRHQYQLIGNKVSVAIRRMPYVKGENDDTNKS